jgi:hypothetical protein
LTRDATPRQIINPKEMAPSMKLAALAIPVAMASHAVRHVTALTHPLLRMGGGEITVLVLALASAATGCHEEIDINATRRRYPRPHDEEQPNRPRAFAAKRRR